MLRQAALFALLTSLSSLGIAGCAGNTEPTEEEQSESQSDELSSLRSPESSDWRRTSGVGSTLDHTSRRSRRLLSLPLLSRYEARV